VKTSEQILEEAYQKYKPSHVIALTSWGHDSMVSTSNAYGWALHHEDDINFRVISLDTGLASDKWALWAKEAAWTIGYEKCFSIYDNPDVGFNWYAQDALKYGFGYTPSKHTNFYYRMLKERTIRKIVKHYKSSRHDHIMFVSGVYRAESLARANVPEYEKMGSSIWVNPLCYWTKAQIESYRVNHGFPDNPFYQSTGGSGDCNCNWGQFVSLAQFKYYNPVLGSKLETLSNEVKKIHGYGWGEKPSAGLLAENRGQLTLLGIEPLVTPNLCAGCTRPKQNESKAIDDYLTNVIDW
jgi:3'-phosphoadenosine 5'-phosphosulfate sulfotransferase (PAPS reductase)/FAD synthetase